MIKFDNETYIPVGIDVIDRIIGRINKMRHNMAIQLAKNHYAEAAPLIDLIYEDVVDDLVKLKERFKNGNK